MKFGLHLLRSNVSSRAGVLAREFAFCAVTFCEISQPLLLTHTKPVLSLGVTKFFER